MLHLRQFIKLKVKHRNPLEAWDNAQWMYEWSKPKVGEGLCTWLVFIIHSEKIFSMRNPGAYRWSPLPQSIQDKLPALSVKMDNWNLGINEHKFFLGPYPPKQIPDAGTHPWHPEQTPEQGSVNGDNEGGSSPITLSDV
ncbi:hypothetical protein KC19_10G073500, partial [Ceratodon purpureus]